MKINYGSLVVGVLIGAVALYAYQHYVKTAA